MSGETYTIKVTAPLNVEMLNSSGGYKLKTYLVALNGKDFNVILDLSDSGLTQIPTNAFGVSSATTTSKICQNLSGCILPSGLTNLGQSCFQNTGIKSMDIPATVTTVGGQEFAGCTSLTTVTVDCPTVPDFTGCSSLNSVLLKNTVETITSFQGCSALTSITIPESVTTIKMNAFSGCTSLETVIFSKTEGWKANSADVDVTDSSLNAEVLKQSGDNRVWTNSGS